MEEAYHDELRFIRQIEASTLLLLAIAIIGVFCLTMFETEYRRKEIAIRKVMGSSIAEILLLFIKRYTLPLVVSFLVAAPLGYYLCEHCNSLVDIPLNFHHRQFNCHPHRYHSKLARGNHEPH